MINFAITGITAIGKGFGFLYDQIKKVVEEIEEMEVKLPKSVRITSRILGGVFNQIRNFWDGLSGKNPFENLKMSKNIGLNSKPRNSLELNAKIDMLSAKAKGKNVESTKQLVKELEKVNITAKKYNDFTVSNSIPNVIRFSDEVVRQVDDMTVLSQAYDRWIEKQKIINENMRTWGSDIFMLINESFTATLINGQKFFTTLGKSVVEFTKKLIAQLAALTAISAIMSAFGLGSFGSIFGAVAGGQGGVLGAIFGSSTSRVSAGGYGTVNGQSLNFTARISGQDLLLVSDRNQFTRSRNG